MKKDNDNAKEKHAKSNSKHQKAVALRTQWLKDNPDKKKEDWDYAIHLKAMNEKFTVKFKEEKTRFLTQPSAKVSPKIPAKPFEGKPSVEVEFLICRSAENKESHRHVCGVETVFLDNLLEIAVKFITIKENYTLYLSQLLSQCFFSTTHKELYKRR